MRWNTLDKINIRLYHAGERISELEGISIDIFEAKHKKEKSFIFYKIGFNQALYTNCTSKFFF